MRRIEYAFVHSNKPLLNIYFTAGYPKIDSTRFVLRSLQDSGVDMIEIGMPYSDPLADGPTIQESSSIALENGMSIKLLFEQLKGMREEISIPIILMGYLNPIMQFGMEEFCKSCEAVGIDGLIIPDLPIEMFDSQLKPLLDQYNLDFIFLISPDTKDDRILELDKRSSGFLYMVSSASTTGTSKNSFAEQRDYFERLSKMNLRNRRMIGFGISDSKSFNDAVRFSEGAIIGSAFIRHLKDDGSREGFCSFVRRIRSN